MLPWQSTGKGWEATKMANSKVVNDMLMTTADTFTPKAGGILVPTYKQYWQLFNPIINIIIITIIIIIIQPFLSRCSKQWSYSMHSSSTLHFTSSSLSVLESLEIISWNDIFLSWTAPLGFHRRRDWMISPFAHCQWTAKWRWHFFYSFCTVAMYHIIKQHIQPWWILLTLGTVQKHISPHYIRVQK